MRAQLILLLFYTYLGVVTPALSSPCKRLAWFTAIDVAALRPHAHPERWLKALIISWKLRAPSLEAHLIALGELSRITKWAEAQGVIVHLWPRLTFVQRMAAKMGEKLPANLVSTWGHREACTWHAKSVPHPGLGSLLRRPSPGACTKHMHACPSRSVETHLSICTIDCTCST